MKIVLTSLYFAPAIGGIETVSMVLAREFAAAGHSVKVVTRTPDDNSPNYGFEVVRAPSFGELMQATRWCDIFFQNNISVPLALPLLFVRRPWFICHQTWIPRPSGFTGLNHQLKFFLLRFANSISISRAVAAAMPAKSELVPNPYDASVFYERDGIARNGDIVALGRLVSDKGFDLLIESLALLAKEGCTPKMTIIGDGPEKPKLIQLTQDLGLGDQVTFNAAMKGAALAEELNRHRIMVVPSRWKEPFGIVALEGIACGCVAIGSRDGGLADAIGPCGPTFPNGDAAALAAELSRLLKDPALRAEYRLHAKDHLQMHRAEVVAARYLEIFERSLQRGPAST
jgi:glycogen(starch) synthase